MAGVAAIELAGLVYCIYKYLLSPRRIVRLQHTTPTRGYHISAQKNIEYQEARLSNDSDFLIPAYNAATSNIIFKHDPFRAHYHSHAQSFGHTVDDRYFEKLESFILLYPANSQAVSQYEL